MPENGSDKAAFWLAQLKKGIALKKRQLAEWENFGKTQADTAKKHLEKDEAAIRTFEQKLDSVSGTTKGAIVLLGATEEEKYQ